MWKRGTKLETMSIAVRIPTVMRTNVGGNSVVECTGNTIAEVLEDLTVKYPDIKNVLFKEQDVLHKYVNLYLDEDDIRYIGGLEAQIGEAKELTILPAVAGGAS